MPLICKFEYLQVQLIEKVSVQNDDELANFCGKEKKTGKRNYFGSVTRIK